MSDDPGLINPAKSVRQGRYPPKSRSRGTELLDFEDRLFSARRVRFYASGVLVGYALFIASLLLPSHRFASPGDRFHCVDFHWMWLSGKLAMAGQSARIFDPSVFSAIQTRLLGAGHCHIYPFAYPPTFVFFTYPLGFLPYWAAFAAWDLAGSLAYFAVIYAIVPSRTALVAAATPLWVLANLAYGHNGFLTAGLMGLSLVLMERRPWLSGSLLGFLTYKPQFGLLFPPALLAARNWRAVAAAGVASLLFGAAAAVAFGLHGWPAFIEALLGRHSVTNPSGTTELIVQSPYGLLHLLGAGAWLSWAAELAVAVVVTLAIYLIWAESTSFPLKAAALCAGSLLVTPYALLYDLVILSVAAAFFISDGMLRGFLPGERTVLLICWAVAFIGTLPSGPILSLILFALVIRRISHLRQGALRRENRTVVA